MQRVKEHNIVVQQQMQKQGSYMNFGPWMFLRVAALIRNDLSPANRRSFKPSIQP